MKRFAISILASKSIGEDLFSLRFTTSNTLMIRYALSKEEAIGIGTIEGNKLYPIEKGYTGRGVSVIEIKENENEQPKSDTEGN